MSLFLNFDVISAGLTCEINSYEGVYTKEERLWLELQGQGRSRGELILSSGEDICDVGVHLTLTNTRPEDLEADLSSKQVGFLIHLEVDNENGHVAPFIHGYLTWLNSPLPVHLINLNLVQTILLELSPLENENSRWGINKQNRLAILSASIHSASEPIA